MRIYGHTAYGRPANGTDGMRYMMLHVLYVKLFVGGWGWWW